MQDEEIVVTSKTLSTIDKKLKERFAEDIANQSTLMDEIGKLLITLELAIPGVYATVLKLVEGKENVVGTGVWIYVSFLFWALALVLTMLSLFPTLHKVQSDRLDKIEAFYHESAKRKGEILVWSIVFFFVGIVSAVFAL